MIRNKKGSAYYIVLLFSIVTIATASIYVIGQFNFARSFRKDPSKLQCLLNARSGIWYGLAVLDKQLSSEVKQQKEGAGDTTVSNDLFGEDMFSDDNLEFGSDTGEDLANNMLLESNGDTVEIYPFDNKYGSFKLFMHQTGNFRILESTSLFRNNRRKVVVTIGSQPFLSPDTVLFLNTPGMPEGEGSVDGRVAFLASAIDESDSLQRKRFHVDLNELSSIVDEYKTPLLSLNDSIVSNAPVTVQYDEDFSDISDSISGPLFIDGSYRDIHYKSDRTIIVLEELQITGDVKIEGVTFIVAGDVKILDNTKLKNVNIFTSKRIFFAGQSIFISGSVLACGDVEIYEEAQILEKSIIISTGSASSKSQESGQKKGPQESGGLKKPNKAPKTKPGSTKKSNSKKLKLFSLYVRDQAIVDGILIDLRELGGIKTDMETIVSGVLWSKARICHRGRMKGVVKAFVLVDDVEPANISRNYIIGSIKRLSSIDEYYMPYYFGESKIVEWIEE